MKMIFLDVDGVLNTNTTSIAAPSGCMFVEDGLVKRLQSIYYATHARIVLSSSWRMGRYDMLAGRTDTHNARDYNALAAKLLSFGIPINGHTAMLPRRSRAAEIAEYLRKSADIEQFVILDDIPVEGYSERQILTDPERGLTDADVKRAIKLLNSPDNV